MSGRARHGPAHRGSEAAERLDELRGLDLLRGLHAAAYVAEAGVTGEWVFVDPQIEQMLGFTPEEFLADPGLWARQLHPEDRGSVLEEERAARDGARLPGYREYRLVGKDGRVVWVLDDMTLLPGRGAHPMHHGLLYDITARKNDEYLLVEHLRIAERVARGDPIEDTLADLAGVTESFTGASGCFIVVDGDEAVPRERLVVGSSGRVEDEEVCPYADRMVPVHSPAGEPLGGLLLMYPSNGDAVQVRADLQTVVGWVGRLAATAVSRADLDTRMETSLSLLEATLESTADGILVVDTHGRIVGYNSTFREMWRIPQNVLDARDDHAAISHVLSQLSDPRRFVAEVERLYSSPDEASVDVLHFLDGRVFERYSQPQRVDGRSVGRVWSFRDVTSYRRMEHRLRYQAHTDPLTSLPNRTLFMERLTGAVDGLAPTSDECPRGHAVAVLLLDVDDFKTVNDGLGHAAGDQMLAAIARRLSRSLRPDDTAARLGGDEFVVLVEDVADMTSLDVLARRLLDEVGRPVDVGGHSVVVRASMGVALVRPGLSASDVLRNADLAMYTVKRRGGSGYSMFHPDMHSEAMARLELQEDLGKALERGQLRLEYQPLVRLDSLYVVGAEALARWDHPVRGTVGPAEFIPLAEETGLIHRIGRWALEEACKQAAQWRAQRGQAAWNLMLGVNVSPRQLADPDFVSDVRDVLAATGQPASNLVLEITEGALAQPVVDAAQVLSRLKGLGVRLALDDFGTSHSSLGRLDQYPLDVIKIDKTFVDRLERDTGGSAFVEVVVGLAQALGMDVIAEGVASGKQLGMLRAVGCEKGQGYLFSEPVPADRFTTMLDPRVLGLREQPDAGAVTASRRRHGTTTDQP